MCTHPSSQETSAAKTKFDGVMKCLASLKSTRSYEVARCYGQTNTAPTYAPTSARTQIGDSPATLGR